MVNGEKPIMSFFYSGRQAKGRQEEGTATPNGEDTITSLDYNDTSYRPGS